MKSFRTGKLEVRLRGSRAVFVGRLDESVQLGDLVDQLPPGDAVIDAAGITFVNSIGMREWIRLMRALRDRGPATQLIDAAAEAQVLRQMQLPAVPCPECRAAMELADYPERYVTIFRDAPGG